MNLKKNCCKFSEVVCETKNEKIVECDFIVPDYYADILKIVHTEAMVRVKSKYLQGEKYVVEGYVDFKIFYTSQELNKLVCVSTPCDFSTSFELKSLSEDSFIKTKVNVENVMARAISERKLSPKATLQISIKVWSDNTTEVVEPCAISDMQQKSISIDAYNIISHKSKAIAISEDIEISNNTEQIQSILKSDAKIVVSDVKALINKAVIHGFAQLKNIYVTIDDEICEVESKIPFTQIVEMDSLDEMAQTDIVYDICEVMCILKQTDAGENRIISVDLEAIADIRCINNTKMHLLSDAFSINDNSIIETKNIKYDKLIGKVTDVFMDKVSLELEYDVKQVIYADNKVKVLSFTTEEGKIKANCELSICLIIMSGEDEILSYKKTMPFKMDITCDDENDNLKFEATINLMNWSYNITSDNTIDIRFEVEINNIIIARDTKMAITNIKVDEDNTSKIVNCAPVTIYYAKKGENIWDISKKYNTVGDEIKSLNELTTDKLENDIMLIIPKTKYVQ